MNDENSINIKQKIEELFNTRTENLLNKFTSDVDLLEDIMDKFTEYYHTGISK